MLSIRSLFRAKSTWLTFCFIAGLIFANSIFAQADTNKFSDFAVQIPESNTEVFAVNNVLGHLEAVFNNKALLRTLKEGAWGDLAEANGEEIDLDWALDALDENREYYPDTVAISGSDEIYAALFDMFHVFLRVSVAQTTLFNDDFDEAEYKLVQNELAELLQEFEIPDATVWIQWSDQELATKLFEDFQQLSSSVGLVTELKYERGDNEFLITGQVEDFIGEADSTDFLNLMGLDDPEGKIVGGMLKIKIFFKTELIDGGMRVSIGSDPVGKPASSAADMIGLRDGTGEIAYGRWDGTKMLSAAKVFEEDLERWGKTGLGKAFIANDIEDVWGTFSSLVQQINQVSANGHLRVWSEKNQVLASVREVGLPAVKTLVDSKILQMIPADAESFGLSNHYSFGEMLLAWMENAEERMSTNSLRSELDSDFEMAEAIDSILLKYYENFAPMRNTVRSLAEVPALPFGFVMDTKGELKSFQLDLDLLPEPFTTEADPFPRMAAISQVNDTGQMESKLTEVYENLVGGVFAINEVKIPKDVEFTREIDLGSGVTGKEFLTDWSDAAGMGFEIQGDVRLHIFVKGDFVVFSTSVELSREIIETKQAIKLKAVEQNQAIVDYGRVQGVTVGNSFRALFQLLGNSPDMMVLDLVSMGDGMGELCEIMNDMTWNSTQSNGVRNSLFTLDFKDK